MSRKHFQALADEIRGIADLNARRLAANAVARVCAAMNADFKRGRFMNACGLDE